MGSYLVRADVETELSVEFTETSQPTTADVESMIEDTEAEVLGAVHAVKLAAPTESSNPYAFKIIHTTVLWGVCSRVQAAYGGNVMNTSPREDMYWERYETRLARITKNPEFLVDATELSSEENIDVNAILDGDDEYHDNVYAMDDEY